MSDPLRLLVEPELSDAALLLAFEGWNDAGEAASSAVEFVEESIHAVPLGGIDGEEFYDFTVARPVVRSGDQGPRVEEWPSVGFTYGAIDAARELVLGRGVEPHLRWRQFSEVCVRLARRVGVRRIVLLGAYLADVVYSRPVGITGFASRHELMQDLGVAASGYEGPTGIVGVLADRFTREGFEVVSLWACLPHYISASPNPRGALALVQKLGKLLDLKLDTSGLEREAARFEERISALVASDPELGDYVRQLKKREFAQ